MADGKETYPFMPERAWWELRRKFKQTIPTGGISTNYLATVLDIGQKAAANIRPTLRRIGLIDDEGTKKDRATQWRDDEQYAKVCDEIKREVYPQELLDLFPSPTEAEREAVQRWFANKTKVGSVASKMMASFYILLSEADPSAGLEVKAKAEKPKAKPKQEPKARVTEKKETVGTKIKGGVEEELGIPSININIEVHISADATTTQIDKIFESMAKHLNIRRKIANE